VRHRKAEVVNMYPRVVTREGNRPAQEKLWKVFRPMGGRWRGIAHIPNGNLRLTDAFAPVDARRRFRIDLQRLWDQAPPALASKCICGDIMAGLKQPTDCEIFGTECVPDTPVGACMVSSEGSCKIWHTYGGLPDLREVGR
jgi:hydrogenase expression/formation protein HypD